MRDINLFCAKRGLSMLAFWVLLASFLSIADVHANTMTLRPDADGTSNQWSIGGSSPASTRWESVNESTPDGDTTYVTVSSGGQLQDFSIANNAYGAGTINSVTIWARAKYASGSERMLICVVSGATTDCSTNIKPGSSYVDYSNVWTTNPDDFLAWDWADIDALQAEVQSKAVGPWSGELRVTQAWIVVDYTPSWTWDSYTDSACTSQSDSFTSGNTVWVCGIDFKPNADYDVAVYDGADARQCYANPATANSTGGLKVSCVTSGGDADWHSQVFTVNGAPTTYDGNDPDELVEDLSCGATCAFTITGAPEFGYVVIPLIMSGMFYLWMRRRFSERHPAGLT